MAASAFFAVILAGGSGTRLWPLSRASNPKFLHAALTGTSTTLLQATAERLESLSPGALTFVVTGAAHATAVARQLPGIPDTNIMVEPSPRDSCAAIGLAAAVIVRRDPEAVMGSFAADHLVRDTRAFEASIRAAMVGARQDLLMTVGITPSHPETGYGYLQCGGSVDKGVIPVTRFKEKPSQDVAVEYLASGRYLWNASMFVWRAKTFLAELRRQQPELFAGLSRIADAWGGPNQDAVLGDVWPTLPKISVDHAVMEGAADAGLVATVPGDFGWTDVGDFDTLGTALAAPETGLADEAGNVIVAEPKDTPVLLKDTESAVVVVQSGRLVATLGVRDLIIVDTPDALLVCARDRAQDLKSVVDDLAARQETTYL